MANHWTPRGRKRCKHFVSFVLPRFFFLTIFFYSSSIFISTLSFPLTLYSLLCYSGNSFLFLLNHCFLILLFKSFILRLVFMFLLPLCLPQYTVENANLYSKPWEHPTIISQLSYTHRNRCTLLHIVNSPKPLSFPLKSYIYKGSNCGCSFTANTAWLYCPHSNLEKTGCWNIKVKESIAAFSMKPSPWTGELIWEDSDGY